MDRNALIAAFIEKYSFGDPDLDDVFRADVVTLIDTLLDPNFDAPLDAEFKAAGFEKPPQKLRAIELDD